MRAETLFWSSLGAGVIAISAALAWLSRQFDPRADFFDLPLLPVICLLILGSGGIVFLIYRRSATRAASHKIRATGAAMLAVFCVGLAARLLHFGAIPILEDDFQRYLWDGAQTAQGLSPYTHAPQEFLDAEVDDPAYWDLAETAWPVITRINHPEYRTVYPPAAQGAFALAYWIAPLSLDAWRAVLLIFEAGIFAVVVTLLSAAGRSPLWAALYWWHPLAIKEVANSAHMEPLVVLPVMAAALLILKARMRGASALLAIGAAVKVWPVLLMVPLVWSLRNRLGVAAQCAAIFGVITAALFWPVIASGLNETSGFVAFASNWAASSAAILVSDFAVASAGNLLGFLAPQMASRALLGITLIAVIAAACLRGRPQSTGPNEPLDILWPYFVAVAGLFVLSASVTPWYVLWLLPFLCLFPSPALLLSSVLIGFHYSYFPLSRAGTPDLYRYGVVWAMWLPVWAGLAWHFIQSRHAHAQHV